MIRDLRYAVRALWKSPGFTLGVILVLALGVGANSAIFSLTNAVLLRPLPYDQPDRLVLVWESAPFFGLHDSPVAPANYVDWKARSRSFQDMGASEDQGYRLTGDGNPEVVPGTLVTAGVMRALRLRPQLGRIFNDDDDRPGATKVVVLSDGFWRRRFAADPNIIGKGITLQDEKHTVVGVLAPGTEPPSNRHQLGAAVWTPLGSAYTPDGLANRGRHNWMVVGRLRDGVQLREADQEMKMIGATLSREHPETNAQVGAFVAPLRDHFVAESRRILFILLGTVLLVLLIACANTANLLLSRAAARSKEVAIRAALGAGVQQLMRQFLSESLLLCTAGCALGLLLGTTTFRFLAQLAPGRLSQFSQLAVDGRVLAFTVALAFLISLIFGLTPLLQVRHVNVSEALKQGARTLAAGGSRQLRRFLVCSEVALAFLLLVGAGLLLQTVLHLQSVDVGCRTQNVLTLGLPPSRSTAKSNGTQSVSASAQLVARQREVLRRVSAIPGVLSAGFTNHIPLVVKGDISGVGGEGRDPKERIQSRARMAGPGYFRTMGIPLLRGRDIEETDGEDTPAVVVINERLAQMLWPNLDPIGRRLILSQEYQPVVIGVVGNIRQSGLNLGPNPEFYRSALQLPQQAGSLAIHSSGDPAALSSAVRNAIWSFDPDQPITEMATMQEILDKEVVQQRVQTTLLGAFALLALLLASIGLYSVLGYLVRQQVPEIGIRMALGATRANIVRGVLGQALRLTLAALGMGIVGALLFGRALGSVLFGVRANDPATYAMVSAVLLTTAMIASYLPARRAMQVDPNVALRQE